MNERIKELIKQAGTIVVTNGCYDPIEIFNKEKFAELIVRECIAQCNDGDSKYFIAKYFGIKE